MFDQFTPPVLEAVENAQVEARNLGHNYIGTEHMLIVLSARPDTTAGRALQECGIETARLREGLTRKLTGTTVRRRDASPNTWHRSPRRPPDRRAHARAGRGAGRAAGSSPNMVSTTARLVPFDPAR